MKLATFDTGKLFLACLAITAASTLLTEAATVDECKTEEDECGSRYFGVPLDHQRVCLNGTCTCNPDQIYTVSWSRIQFCIPKLVDTHRPCEDNSNCDPLGETCLQNGTRTCWECSLGSLNRSSGECEGPFHGGICGGAVLSPYLSYDGASYSRPCQGEGLTCDRDSKRCACKEGILFYNETLKGCSPLPKLGDDCSLSKSCRDEPSTYGFSQCSKNNTCICASGMFGNQTNYCTQRPTGWCSIHAHCPKNARCIGYECECIPGFVDSRNGECLRFMSGARCEPHPDAQTLKALEHQRLKCINGAYRCKKPVEQYYDGGPEGEWHWSQWRHICVTEVGGDCLPADDVCTEGSSCVDVDGGFKCQCDSGFSSTPENKCLRHEDFGANCTDKPCNHFAGVACIDEVCQCPDEKIEYDPVLKRCLSPEGYFCGALPLGPIVEVGCQAGLSCESSKGPQLSGFKCIKNDQQLANKSET